MSDQIEGNDVTQKPSELVTANVQSIVGSTGASLEKIERYLTFAMGPETYGIPLVCVREVIALADITPVPFTPSYFLGIMNLRGRVTSVIDLRRKFRLKKVENTSQTSIIIADLNPYMLGLVVDSISSVMALPEKEINPRPQMDSHQNSEYIIGVAAREQKLILLLDLMKALMDERDGVSSLAAA